MIWNLGEDTGLRVRVIQPQLASAQEAGLGRTVAKKSSAATIDKRIQHKRHEVERRWYELGGR
jgi:hypothetical protein